MKRRMISLLLSIVMCISLCTTAYAGSTESQDAAKISFILEKCDFPREILMTLDSDIINAIYEEALIHYIQYESYQSSQYDEKVGDLTRTVSDGSFTLNTLVFAVYSSDRVTFLYYAVYTQYEWTTKPSYHMTDAITVNWNSSLLAYQSGSFYYTPYYKLPSATSWNTDSSNSTTIPDNLLQGGLGLTFHFYGSQLANYFIYKGTAFLKLVKVSPSSSGNTTTINSNYGHTVSTTGATSISIGTSGVNVTITCSTTYQNAASSSTVTIP